MTKISSVIKNEFNEFTSDSSLIMPLTLEKNVMTYIKNKLNPNISTVFLKACIIQLLAGGLLISICPQLGVGFSYHSYLMELLMHFGHQVCTFICGSLFFILGVLGNFSMLSKEEFALYYYKSFQFQILILIVSLSILLLLGAKGQLLIFTIWSLGGFFMSTSFLKLAFKAVIQSRPVLY